jgi:cell division protein FtsQ
MVQRRRQNVRRTRRPAFRLAQVSPRLLRLAAVLSVVLVLLGGWLGVHAWLNNPENLPISQIDIQGELKFIKDAELRKVIEKYTHTNLYLLDADSLELDLETTQPWVRSVTLRKVWPDKLIVSVEEQSPLAFWGSDRLMNKYGEVFTADLPSKRGILPVLYSPADNKGREMAERFKQVWAWLAGLSLEVAELTEDESGAWRIKIKQGPEILVGNKDQQRRLERFKVGFQQQLKAQWNNIQRVDLRYTNGFAVEWKQSPVGAQALPDTRRRS